MQYVVGGSVRDIIMGFTPKDIDFVWTETTPNELLSKGMKRVGSDFPVFLDVFGREHALARTERKTGIGYYGFECTYDPSITIEQDLYRRDLTCNAMAVPIEMWGDFQPTKEPKLVIDPYGGMADINNKTLRHVSKHFSEDSIRVLRTARFAARYGFKIADETLDLMERIAPELDFVPAERIWTEIEKGLMEEHPAEMFIALQIVNAYRAKSMRAYKHADISVLERVQSEHDLVTRFALISSGFADKDYIECRVPNDCAIVGRTFNRNFAKLTLYPGFENEKRLVLLQAMHVFNNPWLLNKCLELLRLYDPNTATEERIKEDLDQLRTVDAAAIAATCKNGAEVKEKLFQARLSVL